VVWCGVPLLTFQKLGQGTCTYIIFQGALTASSIATPFHSHASTGLPKYLASACTGAYTSTLSGSTARSPARSPIRQWPLPRPHRHSLRHPPLASWYKLYMGNHNMTARHALQHSTVYHVRIMETYSWWVRDIRRRYWSHH